MPIKPSVPRWGDPWLRISRGAPWKTSVRKTARTSLAFLPILVVSFPSDHVPAPPSPKQKLLSSTRLRRAMSRPMSRPRTSTGSPRSRTVTSKPSLRSCNAAKRPAGPQPTTTARRFFARLATAGGALLAGRSRASQRPELSARSPSTSASTTYTHRGSGSRCRASSDLRTTCRTDLSVARFCFFFLPFSWSFFTCWRVAATRPADTSSDDADAPGSASKGTATL
mmetsp:Transcript_24526/g.79247  ORF Transcript_24526/g.79247 Transcript_24526/m.79247 type:complete len:225 (+) Transcript_24526:226-900(+)